MVHVLGVCTVHMWVVCVCTLYKSVCVCVWCMCGGVCVYSICVGGMCVCAYRCILCAYIHVCVLVCVHFALC